MLTAAYALLFYVATAVLAAGLAYKIAQYARTPAPLKIATTPAPVTAAGVVARLAREVVFFESLFKSNKWLWIFGWAFHGAMALVIVRHLRYFTEPVWTWVALIQPIGALAGFAMLGAVGALWLRRVVLVRVRYVTGPSDHLMLLLLAGIAGSGLMLTHVARTDVVALKAFALGLLYVDWQPLPADPALLVHLGLVAALMIVLPFSKILHAPGVFFSPTRNQIDNPRERRHVPPWAAEVGRDGGRG